MNDSQINAIVEQVVRRLSSEMSSAAPPSRSAPAVISSRRPGVFDDLDSATSAAQEAQRAWVDTSLEVRAKVIEAMRECTRRNAEQLAQMAVDETGLGNFKDKIQKNLLCAN